MRWRQWRCSYGDGLGPGSGWSDLLLASAVAAPAYAQTPVAGTPFVMTRRAQPYTPITGGTQIFAPGSSSGQVATITLPFPFKYYDRSFTS